MRSLVALAAVTGALLGVACTNDYDALLAGASGGGTAAGQAPTSSTDASSSSDAATGTTTGSTATTASTAAISSSASDGSGGQGGQGGTAGTGGEGGAGSGGAAAACSNFQLRFEDETDLGDLDNGWSTYDFDASLSTEGGALVVRLEDAEFARAGVVRDIDDGEIDGCTVESSVVRLANLGDAENGDRMVGIVGIGSGDDLLAGVFVGEFTEGSTVETVYGLVVRDDGADEGYRTSIESSPVGPLPTGLRVRGVGSAFQFEARLDGGAWKPVGGPLGDGELEDTPDTVMVGALRSRKAESDEGKPLDVALGAVNGDTP